MPGVVAGPAVVSPGTSVVAADAKATCAPSPLTAGQPLAAFPAAPAVERETISTPPVELDQAKTSICSFSSSATRSPAALEKATTAPLPLIAGVSEGPSPCVPAGPTESRVVVPAPRSRRKTCR